MKPILFNTEMVRAILDNRKTVTRRVCHITVNNGENVLHKRCCTVEFPENNMDGICAEFFDSNHWYKGAAKPPYHPGDILYVRETWYYETGYEDIDDAPDLPSGNRSWRYMYKADTTEYPVMLGHWHPSIHMPREAARIFLRVTAVSVERLQDIDDDGIVDEGLEIGAPFEELWDSTIKPKDRAIYGWDANPWVWVIEFERMSNEEAGNDNQRSYQMV